MGGQRRRAEDGRNDDLDFALSAASRLKIVRRVGAGGMGVVYEALDLDRNVRVALKTLPETNPQTLYRFKHDGVNLLTLPAQGTEE